MKSMKLFPLILFWTFCLMVSCSSVDEYEYNYTGALLFTLKSDTTDEFESLDAYTLLVETEEIYGSIPNYLVHEADQSSDEINVHILDVDRSESMYHALGPAIAEIDVRLSSVDIYSLKFHNGDYIDKYSLRIEADTLTVVLINSMFTEYSIIP
ncbi:MAG: hypothetical protein HN995_06975 [Candidatus Marinimicrobia bacterium]|nr:hypothetical protein [Candidatus Neomarinimicrobiota bacterium]MBT3680968.1 hypothetical protein [Candidatus Neomarinimicrobiota bacterium]MBT3952101.1 hypothetical protein [Candidatus Neomarinimicrobiota bacterium]MBT4254299.1 hypothetical protein [Candidatus Neomarinimicrobiota bacterium]MBT4479480.1 hypothetical protein [Candidatus Neomarinimicrobiota bacterium]